ncbi:MAG: sulfotransferase [Gammaproteobacteria bacterium]|nr:sulfotransferase [Gammaproteobacteria bacterium]
MTSSITHTSIGGRLPNFLLIGAMKAGTTSLYHYLCSHPQVYMPPYKAPEFFAEGSNWRRGLDWYRRQFASAGPEAVAIGEASNVYTKYPHYPGVPQRIAAHIPEVRLIYVVRDPIDRIRSHYQTKVAEGTEQAPFEEAVFENPIYADYSRYALQIEQYLEYFSWKQLLVITAEDLRNDRQAIVRRVYQHLGVDADFVPSDLDREFYKTQERAARSPIPRWLRKGLKKYFPASKRAKELENNVLRMLNRLRRGTEQNPKPSRSFTIPEAARERLVYLLEDDVRRLRRYIGPDFHAWGIGG